jgi:predicted PurR-regulated permease PerM
MATENLETDNLNNRSGLVATKEKVIAIIVLTIFFMTVWFMLDMVLLIFIISFIFFFCLRLIRKPFEKTPLSRLPDAVFLVLILAIVGGFVFLCSIAFVPILVDQSKLIANGFIAFDFGEFKDSLDPRIARLLDDVDIDSYINQAGTMMMEWIVNVGKFGINIVLALAISFILLVEKRKILLFGKAVENSRLSFLYRYFMLFGENFCRTFAKVMKVQVTIAFVNSILSIIILAILGFKSIIWGLGVMIFLLGLIPVAGVIISFIPLSIIAFNLGGIPKVIAVILMVCIIHAIEAYILNPKLMSNRTNLPVSFVFIILLVAEQYLKVWGLLIGVPIVVFLLSMFGVDYEHIDTRKPSRILKSKKLYGKKKGEDDGQ